MVDGEGLAVVIWSDWSDCNETLEGFCDGFDQLVTTIQTWRLTSGNCFLTMKQMTMMAVTVKAGLKQMTMMAVTCLKWGGGGGLLRDLSKNLKQGVGKDKSCS